MISLRSSRCAAVSRPPVPPRSTHRFSRLFGNFGRSCPILAAFLCTAAGVYIYTAPPPEVTEGNGVRAASVFRSALLVLLWKLKVYPASFKKLTRFMQYIVEFLLAMYIIEYIQGEFWIPLEAAIKNLLGKASQFSDENLRSMGLELGEYIEILRNEWTACFVVYGVSLFFFISVLHATKCIDLRDMKYGPEPFIYAIIKVYQKMKDLSRNERSSRAITNKRGGNQHMIKGGHIDLGWKDRGSDRKDIALRDGKYDKYNHRHRKADDDDCSDFEMDFD